MSWWSSDMEQVKDQAVAWLRNYFAENGANCSAVIGISGGKDSTVAAALCVEALGKDRVVGVMMPNGEQADIEDALRVCEILGIPHMTINIKDAYDSMVSALSSEMAVSEQTLVNIAPRLRMATLYAVAQSLPNGGRVANTCNFSEDYVGYSTKFGDSAGDFGVLSYLMVWQVQQLGDVLCLPKDLVYKTPSDGLCGKTDEDNLGFTYRQLDEYIEHETSGDPLVDAKIADLHQKNLHKVNLMPMFMSPILSGLNDVHDTEV